MQRIESLLRQTMGLDSASIGSSALQRAVQERCNLHRITDLGAYWECLRASETELQQLIETVVVPETWFFRDRGAFAALSGMARGAWLRQRPGAMLRLLSLPCSSGEEPYSMAMALLQDAVPAESFRIDAIDISVHALERARRGIYGRNSFRGDQLAFRDQFFEQDGDACRVTEAVRQQVAFQPGNLFAADLLPGRELYDAIFCRNVLIYFDRAAQARAVAVLSRLLKPGGALFVAPAETALLQQHGFDQLRWPRAFAFRKAGTAAPARPAQPARPAPAPAAAPSTTPASPPPSAQIRLPPPVSARPQPSADGEQAAREISQLADRGQLEEAAEACRRHLRDAGPTARVLYLLGLILDGRGCREEAEQRYRQALYLEPTHREAMAHLALLLDKQGDAPAAALLRGRLRRLEQADGR